MYIEYKVVLKECLIEVVVDKKPIDKLAEVDDTIRQLK